MNDDLCKVCLKSFCACECPCECNVCKEIKKQPVSQFEYDEQEEESIIFRRGVVVLSPGSDVVEDIVFEDSLEKNE